MKNKEKYAKEILDIYCNGYDVAMNKDTMELQACGGIECEDCYFFQHVYPHNAGLCARNFIHWVNAEYKEKKEFSGVDKAYVRAMDKLNWFAKDKSGDVWGFQNKPFKKDEIWCTHPSGKDLMRSEKVYSYFTTVPFEPLSWDDEEPTHRSEILGEKDE